MAVASSQARLTTRGLAAVVAVVLREGVPIQEPVGRPEPVEPERSQGWTGMAAAGQMTTRALAQVEMAVRIPPASQGP